MTRDEAKEMVQEMLPDYLRMKGINPANNFRCLNPDHNDHDPSMGVAKGSRGIRCHCFSCGAVYDTLDLIGLDYGLDNMKDQLDKAIEIFGLTDDGWKAQAPSYRPEPRNPDEVTIEPLPAEERPNLSLRINEAAKALWTDKGKADLDYYRSRGFTDETIRDWNLGTCPSGYNAFMSGMPDQQSKGRKTYLYTRVIPYPSGDYCAFEINDRSQVDEFNGKYRKVKGLKAPIFNEQILTGSPDTVPSMIFVVEGIWDALSVEQEGGRAIALVGVGGNRLLSICQQYKPKTTFILALDADGAGQAGMDRLKKGLNYLGIPFIETKPPAGAKDFNEVLQKDKAGLGEYIRNVMEGGREMEQETKVETSNQAENQPKTATETGEDMLDRFLEVIQTERFKPLPTGLPSVDRALDGGFTRRTLVLFGAAPGMGKTVFCQWILEYMAKNGASVLYINLEMDRNQLLARSISRLAWVNESADLSALDVMRGYDWDDKQRGQVERAVQVYKETIAPRFIYNPTGTTNKIDGLIKIMESAMEKAKAEGREAPIVCIDYLQLIDSGNKEAAEGMKDTIKKLKDFAVMYDTVVLAIMANNRASNKAGTADMESGRDTSALEYSGDLMLALAYTAVEDKEKIPDTYSFDDIVINTNSKVYTPDIIRLLRKVAHDNGQPVPDVCNRVCLKVNKNRFGESEKRVKLIFDGKHAIFREDSSKGQLSEGWQTLPKGKSLFDI